MRSLNARRNDDESPNPQAYPTCSTPIDRSDNFAQATTKAMKAEGAIFRRDRDGLTFKAQSGIGSTTESLGIRVGIRFRTFFGRWGATGDPIPMTSQRVISE